MAASREIVYDTLNFKRPERVPRHLWVLSWAKINFPEALEKIRTDFPDDLAGAPGYYRNQPPTQGHPEEPGEYIDEWGCRFINHSRGHIGEVKEPLVKADDWSDWKDLRFPEELLSINTEQINRFCRNTDKFVLSGRTPRPFERLQFLRTSELLYMDLADIPPEMTAFMNKLHSFYCELLEKWAATEVDGLAFMDDWGSQNTLLINPKLWRQVFKPFYRDYIDIAHKNGKKIFMHSDGHILDIIPDLCELGLDALNSQIFCMGIENLEQFRGKICFWGEMDRQYMLTEASPDQVIEAVGRIGGTLWKDGGCIAQCEFGPGAKPENVRAVFEGWERFSRSL